MNILFISEYYPPKIMGGGEINLALLAEALAKRENNIFVLTSKQENNPENEIKNDVQIIRTLATGTTTHNQLSNFKRSFVFPRSILREIKKVTTKYKIDIIHFIGTSIIIAQKLKNINIPFFATIESYPSLCPKGDRIFHNREECKITCSFQKFLTCQQHCEEIGKMPNKMYIKYNPLALGYIYNYYKKLNHSLSCCNLIAISFYIQKILLLHGYSSTVIPNIIDYKSFAAEEKPVDRIKEKEQRSQKILYLGSLTTFKGPQILLAALKEFDKDIYTLDLYGEGSLKEELLHYINKNNINATIHKPVSYREIPEVYKQADIIVFPSIWPEPFGRIAVEALAAGKKIIASSIGGIQETMSNHPKSLVEPGNVQQLANALRKAITEKKMAERDIEIEKRKEELREYSEETITTKILTTYQKIIKKQKDSENTHPQSL